MTERSKMAGAMTTRTLLFSGIAIVAMGAGIAAVMNISISKRGERFIDNRRVIQTYCSPSGDNEFEEIPAKKDRLFAIGRVSKKKFQVLPGHDFGFYESTNLAWRAVELKHNKGSISEVSLSIKGRLGPRTDDEDYDCSKLGEGVVDKLYNDIIAQDPESLTGPLMLTHFQEEITLVEFFLVRNMDVCEIVDVPHTCRLDLLAIICNEAYCNHNGVVHSTY